MNTPQEAPTHYPPQIKVPATYMRGGTSKGVFFLLSDLPAACQQPGTARDALLLRVIGSPDPYGKHTDGMGGATSSTSKVVIISPSTQVGHDVDYLFGQVALGKSVIDWSGNCGNLTAAVGAFAIHSGLIAADKLANIDHYPVKIWQANISKTIVADVPINQSGEVQETGNFMLDGVSFPAAQIKVNFIQPVAAGSQVLPTGNLQDELHVPDIGVFNASFINAGIPTIFISAQAMGFSCIETQDDWNNDEALLGTLETIRLHGAVAMGLHANISDASKHQHIPKLAFVAPPKSYVASSGNAVDAEQIDLLVRALSMGKMHHAMMGTAAVAIATAAAIPGTLVNVAAGGGCSGAGVDSVTFGHPSGTLEVGAEVTQNASSSTVNEWLVNSVTMSRSARILMEGRVWVPCSS